MNEFDEIWFFPKDQPSKCTHNDAITLKRWLIDDGSRLSQIIFGKIVHTGSEKEMRLLEQLVIQMSNNLTDAANYLKILGIVVERGNAKNLFEICPPRIPLIRKKPRSPFTPSTIGHLNHFQKLKDYLHSSINNKINLNLKEKIGRILVSAVIHGCLLNKSLLDALLEQIKTPSLLVDQKTFYSLSLPWRKTENQEFRRWSPDPLTELLLYQLQTEEEFIENTSIWGKNPVNSTIQAFFKACKIKVEEKPKSLNKFLNIAQVWHHTWLPSFLVHYATRGHISHSLKESSWHRICGLKYAPPVEEKEEVHTFTDFSDDILPIGEYSLDWFDNIRSALRSIDVKTAKHKLEKLLIAHNSNQFSTQYLFTAWAKFMTHNGSAAGNKLKLSTISGYFGSVGSRIIGQLGETDITTLDNDAIEEIYQQVLGDAQSSHHRHNLAFALREFHHFLVAEYNADTIRQGEVFGIGRELTAVDANIITIEEYRRILLELNNDDITIRHPDLPKIARLVLILAFRCGLRRMEVLRLELNDLQPSYPAELLIRPHFHRRLKTKSSVRKLPLHALLTKDESTELFNWFEYRKKQILARNKHPFLFSIPEMDFQCVPEESLFPTIHRAMRKITGDPYIRFHNLRHSFASWTLLRLMIADYLPDENLFSKLPETRKFLDQSLEFREKLYGNKRKTRKHLYAVATLLGHSSPDISLEHYVHFCDFLLSEFTQHAATSIEKSIFISSTNAPSSTVERWWHNGGIKEILKNYRKRAIKQGMLAKQTKQPIKHVSAIDEIDSNSFILDKVWKCIYLRSARKFEYDDLSARFGFSEVQIIAMEERAKKISELKDGGQGSSARHRLHRQILDLSKPEIETILPIPRFPGKNKSLLLREKIGHKLMLELEKNDLLTKELFTYYINNTWLTDNNLIFRHPEYPDLVINYLKFLVRLGVKKENIQFTIFDCKERSKIASRWKSAIGNKWMINIKKNKPTNDKSDAAKMWLGVRPLFSLKMEAENEDEDLETSPAFRYLMVCGAIYLSIHSN